MSFSYLTLDNIEEIICNTPIEGLQMWEQTNKDINKLLNSKSLLNKLRILHNIENEVVTFKDFLLLSKSDTINVNTFYRYEIIKSLLMLLFSLCLTSTIIWWLTFTFLIKVFFLYILTSMTVAFVFAYGTHFLFTTMIVIVSCISEHMSLYGKYP
jgi:hypothetical protein